MNVKPLPAVSEDQYAQYFREDGSPVGLTFVRAVPGRVAALAVRGKGSDSRLSLDDTTKFDLQYARAVDRRLEAIGRFNDNELRQRMLAAKPAFLARHRLKLVPVILYRLIQEPA